MKLEIIGLCAHLTTVLEDSKKYRRLMALNNSQGAQSILDLIQMVRFLAHSPLTHHIHNTSVSRTAIGPIHQASAI